MTERYYKIFHFLGICVDSQLQKVQNVTLMKLAGWNITNLQANSTSFPRGCKKAPFMAYSYNDTVGIIQTKFQGFGKAYLVFGICRDTGINEIILYLNDHAIVQTSDDRRRLFKINFYYQPLDELKILLKSDVRGIVFINSFQLSCKGKFVVT